MRIAPRLVDVTSELVKLCFQNLYYLDRNDNSAAKKYLQNPEKYDFNKILN